jgi:peptide/nickel transport system permease protein
MLNYIGRRLVWMVITLFFISIIGFFLIELPPGDYLTMEIERLRTYRGVLSDRQIEMLKERYGVDQPMYVKYWKWVSGIARGDFGDSFQFKKPVTELIAKRLKYSFLLAGLALIFTWLVSIPVGVFAATKKNTWPDYLIAAFQFMGIAIPDFILAILLMVFAARYFNQDIGGLFSQQYIDAPWSWPKLLDLMKHLWIPVIVVSASSTAWLTRIMRSNLLDVLNMQYIQTARAKGLKERVVIWKHAVRNSLHVLVMMLGGVLPALISGEVIAAMVLALPTIGPLYFDALVQMDMYLAISVLMFQAVALLIGNLIADLLLAWVDPRVRLE